MNSISVVVVPEVQLPFEISGAPKRDLIRELSPYRAHQSVDERMTLNGARGFHPWIKDRFDLTIECIRRHFVGGTSPLAAVIDRYRAFFDLFRDFAGFIDFFLLQDIVTADYAVRFFHPFDDFGRSSPVPVGAAAYQSYRRDAVRFVDARNQRILDWCETNCQRAL